MFKKILPVLLVIVLLLSLTACAGDSSGSDETTTSPVETTTAKTTVTSTEVTTADATTTAQTTKATETKSNSVILMIEASIAAQAGLAGVPENGIVLPETTYTLQEDETVAELLIRAGRDAGIAVAVRGSGQMTFIVSIAGITGTNSRSGWMYSLNGEYIMSGAGQHKLSPGDKVIWHFTMDSGNDLP